MITGFIRQGESICAVFDDVRLYPLEHLVKVQPKKQPILVTENKVEVFEGDRVCIVDENFNLGFLTIYKEIINLNNPRKYFSTIESAEEYVLMNKPSLSVQDVLGDIQGFISLSQFNKIQTCLTELAKSKNL